MVISEYAGEGWHDSIVSLEGGEKKAWLGWMSELRIVATSLSISDGDNHVGCTGGSSKPLVSDVQGVSLPRRPLCGFALTKREGHFPVYRKPEQRAVHASYKAVLIGCTRCQEPKRMRQLLWLVRPVVRGYK